MITAVNRPLADKVRSYVHEMEKPLFIVNNYPARSFLQKSKISWIIQLPMRGLSSSWGESAARRV